ncbi:MAG TPA: MBL fold metallo-hydrolase [Thermohalobaculum sp.]|nr:MBL fold metallo-hydrolase [Thermohalobaculum sp.]
MSIRTLAAGALLALLAATPAAAQDVTRDLTQIKGDVWRFQNNFHFSVLIVTAEGVVVTDPINNDAANWLEAEIATRFGKPITHLIYSHSHGDHASGGAVFADTARVIAHANAPEKIDYVTPDQRISGRTTIRTGGKSIELLPLGPGHGTDMMVMVIRPENVAFVVDVVSPGRLPYQDFPGADIAGLIEQTKAVEALDFEILAPGHSRLGTKEDATQAREYVEWLMEAVKTELKKGRDVEAIVADLDTSAWAGMMAYDQWRDLNIRGMARWLKESGALN